MAKEKNDALVQLSRQLHAKMDTVNNANPNSILNLYQTFDLNGFSYKGQLTSGYGERGTKVSVKVGFNFGNLILPGILTASVNVKVSGEKTRYNLLLIHRQAKNIFENSNGKSEIWSTVHPLSLVLLDGYSAKIEAKIDATAGVAFNPEVDELGLEIDFSATANVNAGITGQVLNLKAPYPRFYPPSSSDSSLATDFLSINSIMTRHQIKHMINDWLKDNKSEEENWERARKLMEEHTKDQRKSVEKFKESIVSYVKQKTKVDTIEEELTTAGASSESNLLDRIKKKVLPPPKTAKLLIKLTEFEKELNSQINSLEEINIEEEIKSTKKESLLELVQQIKVYRKRLQKLQTQKNKQLEIKAEKKTNSQNTRPSPSTKLSHICHLNLFVLDGGANTSAETKGKFKFNKAKTNLNAEAKVSVAGRARRFSYRYQTLCSGTSPLIVTQDTILNYREVDAEAYIKLGGSLDLPEEHKMVGNGEKKKDKKKSFIYRTMIYQSTVLYWLYPSKKNTKKINPALGSGICFGMGVQIKRLIELAKQVVWLKNKHVDKIQPKQVKLLIRIANHLHISQETFMDFLTKSNINQDNPEKYKAEVLLLESGFLLPVEEADRKVFNLRINESKGQYSLPDMLSNKKIKKLVKGIVYENKNDSNESDLKKNDLSLNNIRLRYRFSDSVNRNASIFKLGFRESDNLSIKIERIKTSGHEGIIDIFTWFKNPEHNQNPLKGHEMAVPPVAMIHN